MQAFHFDSVDSTNDAAKRLIRSGELTGSAYLLADEQTAGKGSYGRSWLSPKDAGIYLTVVEWPQRAAATDSSLFTLAAGVACAEVLAELTAIDVKLKPVNDLYVNGCKLGGILTETIVRGDTVDVVITGIGINIRRADRPLPADAVQPICLEEVLSIERFDALDLNILVATLVARVKAWNAVLIAEQLEQVRKAWECHKVADDEIRNA